jgi:hypothetical protein
MVFDVTQSLCTNVNLQTDGKEAGEERRFQAEKTSARQEKKDVTENL